MTDKYHQFPGYAPGYIPDWAELKSDELCQAGFEGMAYGNAITMALRASHAEGYEAAILDVAKFMNKYIEIVNVPAVIDEIRALKGNGNA